MTDFDERFDAAADKMSTQLASYSETDFIKATNWTRPALKAAYRLKKHGVLSRQEIEEICIELFDELEKLLGGEG